MIENDAPFVPSGEYVGSSKASVFAIPREQIPQYTTSPVGLILHNNDKPVEVEMRAGIFFDLLSDSEVSEEFVSTSVENPELGVYEVFLPPRVTEHPANVKVRWEYEFAGHEFRRDTHYRVMGPMPLYDSMNESEKSVVRGVNNLFGDLFDNTEGGAPSFVEEFQTHFNYERIAQLMSFAVGRINTSSQPVTRYGVGPGHSSKHRFPEKWGGLLQLATYVEVLKHFVRTYVEQPSLAGSPGVTYVDRRDYMNRWQQILQDEQRGLEDAIRQFKREVIGFGKGAFLVSGGIYGMSGSRIGSSYGLQARGARFYPIQSMVIRV